MLHVPSALRTQDPALSGWFASHGISFADVRGLRIGAATATCLGMCWELFRCLSGAFFVLCPSRCTLQGKARVESSKPQSQDACALVCDAKIQDVLDFDPSLVQPVKPPKHEGTPMEVLSRAISVRKSCRVSSISTLSTGAQLAALTVFMCSC